jgi:predicted unusual protein kinase regulating ubiquinone biosynthesis (AarF/ABC1/UbiB family)
LGKLAGGIAGNMVSEGARQLAKGHRPRMSDLLLTPANMQKMSDKLSEMRGAAMKVGQLLSMDSGQVLPPELSNLLAQLREDAHQMPLGEVAVAMEKSLGSDWNMHFSRFSFTPLAAASIGQVREAVLKDGRQVAVKIQYPGIRRSIDSDVDNVASLLRLSSAIPDDFDFAPLLDEAKRQLHAEADYRQEAAAIAEYSRLLAGDPRFETLQVIESLSTSEVLTMSFLDGQTIEYLAEAPDKERNNAAAALLELALRELFDWGLVQTDPNFANYLYQPKTGRIQLLDFGATRTYTATQQTAIADLFHALLDGSDEDVGRCAATVGYVDEADPSSYRKRIIELLRTATEPARAVDDYAFANSDLAKRMSEIVLELRLQEKFTRIPPPEILFLHRKLGGLYLLLSRLKARLPVRQIILPYLAATGDERVQEDVRLAV